MRMIVAAALISMCSTAFAQTSPQEWRATLLLDAGNLTTCLNRVRGTISIKNNEMSWTPRGWSYSDWSIPLATDGGADLIARVGRTGSAHMKVPPGSGPRPISTVNQSSGCRYKFVPD